MYCMHMQGVEFSDLPAGRSPTSALGSSGNRGPLSGSINADLTDLSCMLTPSGQARSPTDASREEVRRRSLHRLSKCRGSRLLL